MNYNIILTPVLLLVFRVASQNLVVVLLGVACLGVSLFLLESHLRIMLVQLELVTLTAVLAGGLSLNAGGVRILLAFVALVVGVVEAALGLSFLSKAARQESQELMKFNF